MCESRDGKILVPRKPTAGLGYWIGLETGGPPQVHNNMYSEQVVSRQVTLLRQEHPEYRVDAPFAASGEFVEFDNATEAMEYLKLQGAIL